MREVAVLMQPNSNRELTIQTMSAFETLTLSTAVPEGVNLIDAAFATVRIRIGQFAYSLLTMSHDSCLKQPVSPDRQIYSKLTDPDSDVCKGAIMRLTPSEPQSTTVRRSNALHWSVLFSSLVTCACIRATSRIIDRWFILLSCISVMRLYLKVGEGVWIV